ncbi:MAG: DNA alkylation repair protein [Acidimicrobiales bacterium]|jgi:3-methyladenine DNA glycosylase AlkD
MAEDPEGAVTGNRGHTELLRELELRAGHGPTLPTRVDPGDSYTSGGHRFYRVSVPERRRLVKQWLSDHKQWSGADVLETADSLIAGVSFEEKTMGCMLLRERRDARTELSPAKIERWLETLVGWAEIDSLCQNVFSCEEILADWPAWRALIVRLSKSRNVNQRRASLVLLTGPVRHSSDRRLLKLALKVIGEAAADRDVLMSKAVSWLLRSLVDHHKDIVASYVDDNEEALAPGAVRETRVKLRTGTKRGNPTSANSSFRQTK